MSYFFRVSTASDQGCGRIRDKDPDDRARDHSRQHDLLPFGFLWQEAKFQVLSQWVTFSIKTDSRCWRPLTHQAFGKIIGSGTFTLIAHDHCIQNSVMNIGPGLFVHFSCGGIKRSLAAGRVGCESRVSHFDRTSKFDTRHDPFGYLALPSYPETLMKHVSQLEGVIFSKFECFTST